MSNLMLGDVTFALSAETAGLDRALNKLRQFSQTVNAAEKANDDATASFIRQERAVVNTYRKIEDLNAAIRRAGAPTEMLAAGTRAFQSYTNAMTKGELSAKEFSRAQVFAAAKVGELRTQLRQFNAEARAIEKFDSQIASMSERGTRYGYTGTPQFRQQATAQLGAYKGALAAGDVKGSNAALTQLQETILNASTGIDKAADRSMRWANTMREFERATILAAGPLSGLGSRMAVMAALFESGTIKSALMVAGLAGVTAGFGLLSAEAIKTRMVFDQWEAMMTAATGSQALVADEMKYVTGLADKFGQGIQAVVPSFASFATSARLSGMSLKDQHKTFEAFLTAGSALRWSNEQTGRAFLALEQIMSKGTVQTQEIKLQLGQVLPGAFELAAKAAGKTQAQFAKMMEQGQVLSTDFMPKFAEVVRKVYEDASKLGMQSVQSDVSRFGNAILRLKEAYDESTRTSKIFQGVLEGLSGIINRLAENMDKVIGISAAVVAALTAWFAPAIVGGFMALINLVRGLGIAIAGVGMAASATPLGMLLSIVVRLGAAIAGAAGAYIFFSDSTSKATKETQDFIDKNAMVVSSLKQQGEVSRQVKEETVKHIQEEIAALQAKAQAYSLSSGLQQKLADDAAKRAQLSKGVGTFGGGLSIIWDEAKKKMGMSSSSAGASTSKEMKEYEEYMKQMTALQEQLNTLNGLKVTKEQKNEPLDKKNNFESLADSIRKSVTELEKYKQINDAIAKSGNNSDAKVPHLEAVAQATELLDKMDKLGAGEKSKLSKILRDAGFEAGTLKDQLIAMYEALDGKKKEKTQIEAVNDARTAANSKIAEMQAELEGLNSTGKRSGGKSAKEVEEFRQALIKAKLDQKEINELTEKYGEVWEKVASKRDQLNGEFFKQFSGVVQSGASAFQQYLTDAFTGTENAGKKLFKTLELEIINFVNKMLIIKPMMTALFGDYYTGGTGNGFGMVGGAMASMGVTNFFATGGTAAMNSYIPPVADAVWSEGANASFAAMFANGGIMSSKGRLPIKQYSTGGIARSPQMSVFAEGGIPEAYVPVPSGKIPVEMRMAPRSNKESAPQVTHNYNTIQMTVQTPNADSFRRSERQIKQQLQGVFS